MSDSGYKQGDPVMTAAQAYLTVPQVISSSGGCSLFSLSPLVFNLTHFALKNTPSAASSSRWVSWAPSGLWRLDVSP